MFYQTRTPFEPVKADYDVYMMNCAMSWGQVWMKKQWLLFASWYEKHSDEFDLVYLPTIINRWKSKSWLKYHTRYCIEENKYFVYPYYSLSTNNCDAGTHSDSKGNLFQTVLQYGTKYTFDLPSFDKCVIKYDGFFEPKFLARHLGLNEQDFCSNFYGQKHKSLFKKYMLSVKPYPYKVCKSWDLSYHPFEMNILNNLQGFSIYLYNTTVEAAPENHNRISYYNYFYGDSLNKLYSIIGVKQFLAYVVRHLIFRIRSKF